MPHKMLAVQVPADVLAKIDEHARRNCLSRSAAVRLIILEELKRIGETVASAQPEAAA